MRMSVLNVSQALTPSLPLWRLPWGRDRTIGWKVSEVCYKRGGCRYVLPSKLTSAAYPRSGQ